MRVMRAGAPVVVIALLLALCLGLGLNGVQAQDAGGPLPGTVQEQRFLTLYNATTALTDTGTLYTDSPLMVQGNDISQVARWHSVDVFVTADVSGTQTLTASVQFSADGVTWSDAAYEYVSNSGADSTYTVTVAATTVLTTNTSITTTATVTVSTGLTTTDVTTDTTSVTITDTVTTNDIVTTTTTTAMGLASSVATQPYQRVLITDTTSYLRVPVAGQYMRVKLSHAGSGTVVPAVQVVFRND